MRVAIVLNTRYKMKLLEHLFSHLHGHLANHEIQRITNYCFELLH